MERRSEKFGIALSNVPTINLRNEFTYWWALLRRPEFIAKLRDHNRPIETRYMTWNGMRSTFLTLIVQRSISGVESYVGGFVFDLLGRSGRLDEAAKRALRTLKVPGCSMADKTYNGLPRLFFEEATLKVHDPELNTVNEDFYREVRNPLMHGSEFAQGDVGSAVTCLEHVAKLYGWMDAINPPSRMFREFAGGPPFHAFAPPDPRIYPSTGVPPTGADEG